MLGVASGGVWVFRKRSAFDLVRFDRDLVNLSLLLAISLSVVAFVQPFANPLSTSTFKAVSSWVLVLLCLLVPFVLAGILVCLFLTRGPYKIGLVYGVDLLGAGAGCIFALYIMDIFGGPISLVVLAELIVLTSFLFSYHGKTGALPSMVVGVSISFLFVLVVSGAIPLRIAYPKGTPEAGRALLFEDWNSFSRVGLYPWGVDAPKLWGPSQSRLLVEHRLEQRLAQIDGLAGTFSYRFDGDLDNMWFLRHDVSNLAYYIPGLSVGAVIGIGGGRDLVSAKYFGLQKVTGVELNPIIAELATGDNEFSKFSNIAGLDGVTIVVDEARSWFARSDAQFDIIQMSLIDTWAATGAGAYALSENRLYTVEGWSSFRNRGKTPGGQAISMQRCLTRIGSGGTGGAPGTLRRSPR